MTSKSTGKAHPEGRLLGTGYMIICRRQPTFSVALALFLTQSLFLSFLLRLRYRASGPICHPCHPTTTSQIPPHTRRVAAGVDEVCGEEQLTSSDTNCPIPHSRLVQRLTLPFLVLGTFCLAYPPLSLGTCNFDFLILC